MNHPTDVLEHPSGRGVRVDKELAPLIKLLWELGVPTMECCQHCETVQHSDKEQLRIARISFYDIEYATEFITLLCLTDYIDELMCLSDERSKSGFRIYVWYQPIDRDEPPFIAPSFVIELPTDEIASITKSIKNKLNRD